MDREPFDASGMIRALEDYLDATRPPEPPAPPREKTETEANLEQLLDDLTATAPPAPEPVKDAPPPAAELVDAQPLPEKLELSTDLPRDETVDKPLEISETAPTPIEDAAVEDVVVPETVEDDDDIPAPPQAAPIIQPEPELSAVLSQERSVDHSPVKSAPRPLWKWPLAMAVLFGLGTLFSMRHPMPIRAGRSATLARAKQPSPKPDSLPSDPRSRAIALVLAYSPGGPVTTGEIFRSIAGDPIPDTNWDVRPMGGDRFEIRFVPYRGALGQSNSYEFNVDAAEDWARPRPETAERLRTDALGRLAARSNLEAFRQFLDLGR